MDQNSKTFLKDAAYLNIAITNYVELEIVCGLGHATGEWAKSGNSQTPLGTQQIHIGDDEPSQFTDVGADGSMPTEWSDMQVMDDSTATIKKPLPSSVYSILVHFLCIWNSSDLGEFEIHCKLKGHCHPFSATSARRPPPPPATAGHHLRPPPPATTSGHHLRHRWPPPPATTAGHHRPPPPATTAGHHRRPPPATAGHRRPPPPAITSATAGPRRPPPSFYIAITLLQTKQKKAASLPVYVASGLPREFLCQSNAQAEEGDKEGKSCSWSAGRAGSLLERSLCHKRFTKKRLVEAIVAQEVRTFLNNLHINECSLALEDMIMLLQLAKFSTNVRIEDSFLAVFASLVRVYLRSSSIS
ncbi:hypothetical protein M5K25_026271 [Dendrobium thyrsiflorum]|uniref:Uncharacterized protein n=1 Tax=Dendrobium thyrsiflorum TaxID=117978 RepID=A0ABD0TX21_DENTH